MDQKQLLELARATMRKRGGGKKKRRKGEAARALVEGPAPARERTEEVDSALARIAALDQELSEIARVEEAEESIVEAEQRANQASSVSAADLLVSSVDAHIQKEHEFKDYDKAQETPASAPRRSPGNVDLREAFRMSLIFGPPKGLE